jgi:homoserine kinase type II
MFPDNVFFQNKKVSGIIDFYFSCTDILAYDLAIAINAWCFNKNDVFNSQKYDSLLKGYNSQRKLNKDEIFFLPLLSQAASMRFLLTRLYDWVNTPEKADVIPKNPKEYIRKMKYFSNVVEKINYN